MKPSDGFIYYQLVVDEAIYLMASEHVLVR
jgi:hypothetical protein